MAGAEGLEPSARGFGVAVETWPPRGGLPVCPRLRGLKTPATPRIDAFLMLLQIHTAIRRAVKSLLYHYKGIL